MTKSYSLSVEGGKATGTGLVYGTKLCPQKGNAGKTAVGREGEAGYKLFLLKGRQSSGRFGILGCSLELQRRPLKKCEREDVVKEGAKECSTKVEPRQSYRGFVDFCVFAGVAENRQLKSLEKQRKKPNKQTHKTPQHNKNQKKRKPPKNKQNKQTNRRASWSSKFREFY